MTVRVLGLASGMTDAESHRLGMGLPMTPTSALGCRSGLVVFPGAGDLVGLAGTMQATVTPFTAWIDGTSNPLQGGYPFVSDAGVTLTFPGGETSVARVDRVIARVRDHPYDASGAQAGSVEVLQGQASGAATSLPASSLLLWEVTVPAGATAGTGGLNIAAVRTDRRTYTTALGGVQYVKDLTEQGQVAAYPGLPVFNNSMKQLDVWDGSRYRNISPMWVTSDAGRPAAPFTGQRLWRDDKKLFEFWDGSAWSDFASLHVRKTADQTVTNSTTLVNDNELLLTVRAGTTYELSGVLFYSAHQDSDFKFGHTAPTSAWFDHIVHGTVPANTGTYGPVVLDRQNLTKTPGFGGADATNTVQLSIRLQGVFYAGDGGTYRLSFAQRAAHATGTIMRAGSYLTLRRIL